MVGLVLGVGGFLFFFLFFLFLSWRISRYHYDAGRINNNNNRQKKRKGVKAGKRETGKSSPVSPHRRRVDGRWQATKTLSVLLRDGFELASSASGDTEFVAGAEPLLAPSQLSHYSPGRGGEIGSPKTGSYTWGRFGGRKELGGRCARGTDLGWKHKIIRHQRTPFFVLFLGRVGLFGGTGASQGRHTSDVGGFLGRERRYSIFFCTLLQLVCRDSCCLTRLDSSRLSIGQPREYSAFVSRCACQNVASVGLASCVCKCMSKCPL